MPSLVSGDQYWPYIESQNRWWAAHLISSQAPPCPRWWSETACLQGKRRPHHRRGQQGDFPENQLWIDMKNMEGRFSWVIFKGSLIIREWMDRSRCRSFGFREVLSLATWLFSSHPWYNSLLGQLQTHLITCIGDPPGLVSATSATSRGLGWDDWEPGCSRSGESSLSSSCLFCVIIKWCNTFLYSKILTRRRLKAGGAWRWDWWSLAWVYFSTGWLAASSCLWGNLLLHKLRMYNVHHVMQGCVNHICVGCLNTGSPQDWPLQRLCSWYLPSLQCRCYALAGTLHYMML